MDIAAFVVSLIALAFAGWSVLYKRRQTLAAEDAAADARRSADAAQEAISYRRDEIERGRVDFNLTPGVNHQYILSNDGTHSAYGVSVDTGCLGIEPIDHYDEFRGGQRESYLLQGSLDCTTKHVVVTWHLHPNLSDEPRVDRLLVE